MWYHVRAMCGIIYGPYRVPYTAHEWYHIWIILESYIYIGRIWYLTWATCATIYEPCMAPFGKYTPRAPILQIIAVVATRATILKIVAVVHTTATF